MAGRTERINALRGHLDEFGHAVPQGAANASASRRNQLMGQRFEHR
ncbi:hypothetical protein GTA62_07500 [Roseobacter sp. HKCCD9010]|nr:hypothetical protein [Rhodobacterales bacterium HKCCD4356]NNV14078.1 hypothetical protein [Roseobacter sp. HKCCD7357]NNV18399.1 hypothetical protein [Roseobacter sp. HKCCD8768]NNV27838.1 hypothetical protein [Roseobacter sp. HKCCD8192]NNV32170.1 hypothetical protein [Roseobacter sp. HKCCD9061]NNV36363.1 hypothetical protein [Roseobacter sp. HKCCD9073]NNV40649.1 hypothetical protein [Roseobacter sp. HKCCD9054]NNV44871.1 hypothetical protein [Roseobacter sp. HKCCD6497]NNV49199.1 hypothetic